MDKFFQILLRVFFFILGAMLFCFLLFLMLIMAVFFGIKYLWGRITGKKVDANYGFKVHPMEGFTYFYAKTKKNSENAPRPSQRQLENVTDVKIKEIIPPKDHYSDTDSK